MHGEAFLQDLAVVMIVAAVVMVIFHRFRQPVVLGYIVAGVIIGPHTPPFKLISEEHTIQLLAELGIVFLMFTLGLHFSLRKLLRVGAVALVAASLEILVMLLLGYLTGRMFGWSKMDSIFLGAVLSISSTTIIVKALAELGRTKEPFAGLIFGVLIVQDVLAIAMIAGLSSIAQTGGVQVAPLATTFLKLIVFLAVVLVVGLLSVPALLRFIGRFKSDEVLLITALGLCFGVSLLALKMGYSVALGAFLVGAIIAEAREAGRVQTLIEPVRDMFIAVFFVSIGLLIDPRMAIEHWQTTIVVTLVAVIGKSLSCAAGTFLAGTDPRTALRVGLGQVPIGEFSFIIATLGLQSGVTSGSLFPIVVTVSVVTTLLTPYLIQSSDRLVNLLDRGGPRGLMEYLGTYSAWTARMQGERGGNQQIRRLLWKWALQVGINMVLVTGLFIAAVAIAPRAEHWMPALPRWTGGQRAVVWMAAVIAALPLLVATFRKVRAAAMVVAELSVTKSAAGEQTATLRAVIANTILLAVSAAIVLWVLLLSSTVLPPWPMLVLLLLLIVGIVIAAWGSLVRVYARAQIALKETLTQEHTWEGPPPPTLPPLLRDAVLETIPLSDECAGARKLIRELQLRTKSGASIVGIERLDSPPIVNPGPDEELLPGDRVLVLGNAEQLASARRLLAS